jgi:hypothetical protein
MIVALGALAVSAVCFTVRAAIPHNDPDSPWPFLDFLNFADDKPACRGGHKDQTILTRNFPWNGTDSVAVRMPGTIRYRRGVGEDVSVRAKTWVLNHVRVEEGSIEFDCRNIGKVTPLEITLPGIPLRSFAFTGAGKMYLDDLQQDELKISTSGATKVEANGRAGSADVSIAGISKIDMGQLTARRLAVNIAGSGDLEVAPQDSASINIAGTGRVRLVTEPKELTTHIAGAGRIVHEAK